MTSPIKLFLAFVLTLSASAALTSGDLDTQDGAPPALPDDAMTVGVTVLDVQPFVLTEPATHYYRAEQPRFDRGLVLLLDVTDRDLLAPRQLAEPVLYVGAETAERVNQGWRSGKLVVIVPAVDGDPADLLDGQPVFFGEPALPEQIQAGQARDARALAISRGLAAVPAPMATRSLSEPLPFPDHGELLAWSTTWIATHAPDETDLIRGLTAPRLSR